MFSNLLQRPGQCLVALVEEADGLHDRCVGFLVPGLLHLSSELGQLFRMVLVMPGHIVHQRMELFCRLLGPVLVVMVMSFMRMGVFMLRVVFMGMRMRMLLPVVVAVLVAVGIAVGMLVGVPLAATLYKLSFDVLEAREKKLGISRPAEESEKKPKIKEKLKNKKEKEKNKEKEKQLSVSEKANTDKKES